MHPTIMQELAKIKIAEQIQYAERQRLAKLAVSDRPRPIDFAPLRVRLARKLFGGTALRGRPAGAGA